MAAIASFKAMFRRLGFTEAAAGQLSSEDGEGLNSLDNVKALTDDRARAVCKAVRRPGGAGDGHAVSERAEHNLMICAYVVNFWIRTSRDSKTVPDLIIDPDTLFSTRAQRQKELEASWDNAEHLHLFAPLKSADLEKRFSDLYENFVDSLQNIRGMTGILLKYLARMTLVPNDEADEPSDTFATPDDEMSVRARIILKANENDDDLEASGPEKRTEWAKVDNVRLFELLTTVFGGTFAWVHAKGAKRTRNGRLALMAIWANYNGPHAIDSRHQKVRKDITELKYYGEKRHATWSKYTAKHKELHVAAAILAEQGYSDFTEREKVTYLVDGVQTNELDVPLNIINASATMRSNFEEAQMHVAEHIRLRKGRELGSRNASALTTQGGRGRGGGRGDFGGRGSGRGDGGRGAGRGDGGRGGPRKPLTDEAVMKCTWITECYYPEPEYNRFNPFERRKVYINQQDQKKQAGGRNGGAPRGDKPREIQEFSTVISELSASMASVKESCKATNRDLKRLKKNTGYRSSDHEELFTSSDDNDVDANRGNAALARGILKKRKKG